MKLTHEQKIKKAEAEYGQSFQEIIDGYYDDGVSLSMCRDILRFKTTAQFMQAIKDNGSTTRYELPKNSPSRPSYFEYQGHMDTLKGHAIRNGVKYSSAYARMAASEDKQDYDYFITGVRK